MKESILDVLLYLFEHYFTNDAIAASGDAITTQNGPLMGELSEAGFSNAEIRKAFDWLDALARQRPAPSSISTPVLPARCAAMRSPNWSLACSRSTRPWVPARVVTASARWNFSIRPGSWRFRR